MENTTEKIAGGKGKSIPQLVLKRRVISFSDFIKSPDNFGPSAKKSSVSGGGIKKSPISKGKTVESDYKKLLVLVTEDLKKNANIQKPINEVFDLVGQAIELLSGPFVDFLQLSADALMVLVDQIIAMWNDASPVTIYGEATTKGAVLKTMVGTTGAVMAMFLQSMFGLPKEKVKERQYKADLKRIQEEAAAANPSMELREAVKKFLGKHGGVASAIKAVTKMKAEEPKPPKKEKPAEPEVEPKETEETEPKETEEAKTEETVEA